MRTLFMLTAIALLGACSISNPLTTTDSAPSVHPVHPVNLELTPDAIPRIEPKSRGGNPRSYEVFGKTYYVLPSGDGFVQRGIASWYGTKFHGNKTSNGEIYDMYAMTAAHKSLPIPTYVEVKNLDNGKTIIVRVNDRGPFHDGRIIDLSYAAAAKLGTLKHGTSQVEIRVIDPRIETSSNLESPPSAVANIPASTTPYNTSIVAPINTKNKGFLFIQVGAFSDLNNANKLKLTLTQALGTPVTVKASTANKDPLYLVRVGPYIRLQKADSARLQLHELGYKNIIYATE